MTLCSLITTELTNVTYHWIPGMYTFMKKRNNTLKLNNKPALRDSI